LARLVRQAQRSVVYTGAGLSTAAGIDDYAARESTAPAGTTEGGPLRALLLGGERNGGGPVGPSPAFKSPMCAQPTLSHHVLVAMHAAGLLHRWINQNHDGLPQKAGLPQQFINEIHGAWHAPDNPVVPMSGQLRTDLFEDLLECERSADLVLAVGTSLAGMNSDRVVDAAARRAAGDGDGRRSNFGAVVIGLQRTALDEGATLRFYGHCDDVFSALAEELELAIPAPLPVGSYWRPAVLLGREEGDYRFEGIPYDAAGRFSASASATLDLREGAEVVIPSGMYAGACGEVDSFDREGNVKCIFKLKAPKGKLKAPMTLVVGRWWLQAAVDGAVPLLPVVNKPGSDACEESCPGDVALIELMEAYAK